jgi:hypothetical protein
MGRGVIFPSQTLAETDHGSLMLASQQQAGMPCLSLGTFPYIVHAALGALLSSPPAPQPLCSDFFHPQAI